MPKIDDIKKLEEKIKKIGDEESISKEEKEEIDIDKLAEELKEEIAEKEKSEEDISLTSTPEEKSPFDEDFLNEISIDIEQEESSLKETNKNEKNEIDFLSELTSTPKDESINELDKLMANLTDEETTSIPESPQIEAEKASLSETEIPLEKTEFEFDLEEDKKELSDLLITREKEETKDELSELFKEIDSPSSIDVPVEETKEKIADKESEIDEELKILEESEPIHEEKIEEKKEEKEYLSEKEEIISKNEILDEELNDLLEKPIESITPEDDKEKYILHEELPDEIPDLSSLEIEGLEIPKDKIEIEKPSISKEEIEFKDASVGEIPKEIPEEEIKKDQDITIKLTESERKKIITTLTNLPKEAELKIAKVIISNKYTNKQLKPLIQSLIKGESPLSIIKYYERITGDRSLSKVEIIRRFRGEEFEELQKSLPYLIQKNLIPILVRLSIAALFFLLTLVLSIRILFPTIYATIEYNKGIKKIEEKEFEEGEKHFEIAFNTQPRFNEIIKYARKYRENKRILEAEAKYEHALSWKPYRRDVILEYADFLRETGNFERSEKKYKTLINANDKDIQALIGLGKTYYDWGNEDFNKLNDAEATFKEVLSIDNKNKDALFGNLKVYLKKKEHKKIIAQYNYITKKIKTKGDPEAFALLAEYFIDRNDFDYVKEVLNKAYKSIGKKELYPEVDYQNARYKKALKIFDEEKTHLLSALKSFKIMEKVNRERYESKKYQSILAKVYNDLGENIERKEIASIDAEMYYNKAIETDPDYGKAYYNLANFTFYYKPEAMEEAKRLYEKAIEKGFIIEKLYYNLSKIYYKEGDFYNAFIRLNKVYEKMEYNPMILFMLGTIYYKLNNYDLSESMLLESYNLISDQINKKDSFANLDREDDRQLVDTLKQICNNLGATYQKKYEKTKRNSFLIKANNYYSEAILLSSRLNDPKAREKSHINLRMVLYPYSGTEEPFIYEDFPDKFKK